MNRAQYLTRAVRESLTTAKPKDPTVMANVRLWQEEQRKKQVAQQHREAVRNFNPVWRT